MDREAMTKRDESGNPLLIGWREMVDFPLWKVAGIEAKIDTGARTSAIHVEDVTIHDDGQVTFHLVTSPRKPFEHVEVTAPMVRTSKIRSSTGHAQERIVVATDVRIGPLSRTIEMSLVGRDKMLCRMLLGRTALEGLLINPSERYLLGGTGPRRRSESPKKRRKS